MTGPVHRSPSNPRFVVRVAILLAFAYQLTAIPPVTIASSCVTSGDSASATACRTDCSSPCETAPPPCDAPEDAPCTAPADAAVGCNPEAGPCLPGMTPDRCESSGGCPLWCATSFVDTAFVPTLVGLAGEPITPGGLAPPATRDTQPIAPPPKSASV